MSRYRFPSLAVLVLLVFLHGACHKEDAPKEEGPPAVKVETVHAQKLRSELPVAGVLSPLPNKDVKIGALVMGRVDRVLVAEGDKVKAGQPLLHIEAQPLKNRMAEVDAQKAQAVAALENAKARLARSERLFETGIAARQEVDDARAQAVAAQSALREAQATGGTAGVQLDRATLRAPFDGVVAALLVPAGQPVDGNGTPVIEVADTSVLDLRAPVPAAWVGQVSVGQKAILIVEGAGEVSGTVAAIAPLVDTATNTVLVRIRVVNEDGRLRGGVFARGTLLGPEHKALSVPRSALLPGDGGAANTVAVVGADKKVALHSLKLLFGSAERVEVLDGLSEGEQVIVAGGYTLPEGTVVEVAK